MILVCYDIGANALRARIGRRLLEAGMERINRSVYLGQIKDTDLRRLRVWLQQAMAKAGPDDSLIILPTTPHQTWQMEVLGKNELDIPTITGEQHTLIV
jgi:CRISPR-associated endonuclease Cas2